MRPQELDVGTVGLDLSVGALLDVLIATERGEPPVLGDDDLLATGEPAIRVSGSSGKRGGGKRDELVLTSPQSLQSGGTVGVAGADRQQDLSDVDAGDRTVRLSPSTTHTRLQSIGTSARQHLVDTNDVEGVGTIISSVSPPISQSNVTRSVTGSSSGNHPFQRALRGTCWPRCGRPREPRTTAARTRSIPNGCTAGSRPHRHACVQDRRS